MPFGAKSISRNQKNLERNNENNRRARIVEHTDPDAKTKAARTKMEKSLSDWLKHHGGEAFSSQWSDDHKKVLAKIETAINDGGLFALAMPRGHGKTTILKWTTLHVLLTGRRRYVVIVAATSELAQVIAEFCRQQLIESDTLHEHYPHVTTYARATGDKAIKARHQLRADGKSSGIKWSKSALVLPEIMIPGTNKPYPSNGAILEGHGLTGAIRGKWRDTKTGKVLRPDFVILDDPQTRDSAESISQCAMRERIITGDVLGLAGPKKRIAAVMPCTIIRKGDLADRFLDHKQHPEWQGETCKLINKWPDAQDTLWKDYADIYREETGEGRGFGKATEFYQQHKAEMDAGALVAWESRVRDGEISALQTVENLLLETGAQFWAEYQNEPQDIINSQYELTVGTILNHANDMPRLHIPSNSTVFVGHCDVNHYGLNWCLAAFDQTMTGHCPVYGRWPGRGVVVDKNATEQEINVAIYRNLTELCNQIQATTFLKDGRKVNLQMLLIDVGYKADAVQRFIQSARYSFRVVPSIGRDAKNYRVKKESLVGRPFEFCHIQQAAKPGHSPYLMFMSDYWREVMQRAFLGVPGNQGGFTLHAAENKYHVPFAEHLIAERLTHKGDIGGGMRWEWAHQPGAQWDWGDALTGAWTAAAAMGLSTSGVRVVKKQYTEQRKSKVREDQ